eukprot:TRINITY_DN129_c0_g1_i5.p1 TRINITY_DN129_c0_g1~~TRINITY_DN129_c0_g1_i5.p1  ORF type:complete len:193 (+),score=48.38 TRINITY_DN129_c0_g1_i5:161-739(+)
MSRRYDSRTTIFSPDGRLYQVEYAMEAIGHAGAALGVLAKDGVVLAAEKIVTSKLLEVEKTSEKMYMVDDRIACAVAGIRADANILINRARLIAQQHQFKYQEPMPVEQLIQQICDLKQGYTQFGGMRPFGVSFLFAGYDEQFGYQLYQSCLLYTSDAADEEDSVDLGGRRIIKKKKNIRLCIGYYRYIKSK